MTSFLVELIALSISTYMAGLTKGKYQAWWNVSKISELMIFLKLLAKLSKFTFCEFAQLCKQFFLSQQEKNYVTQQC